MGNRLTSSKEQHEEENILEPIAVWNNCHSQEVVKIVYCEQLGTLFSISSDKLIKEWNLQTGEAVFVYEGHTSKVTDFKILSVKAKLYGISNSDDKTVRVWDLLAKKMLWVFSEHTHWVSSLVPFVTSKKKAVAATSSFDKNIKIWSLNKGKCLRTLEGHTDYVTCMKVLKRSFVFDFPMLITGSADSTIRLWNPESGDCLGVLEGHQKAIITISVISLNTEDSNGAYQLWSGAEDNEVRVWDLTHISKTPKVIPTVDTVSKMTKVGADCILFLYRHYHEITLHKVKGGKVVQQYDGHTDVVFNTKVSQKKNLMFTASKDSTIRIWNIKKGFMAFKMRGHKQPVNSIVIVNNKLYSGSGDGTIRVWDIETVVNATDKEGRRLTRTDSITL